MFFSRTFFNGVWMDLNSENAGVTFVSDSDTQHRGFELQYKIVPVFKEANGNYIYNYKNIIYYIKKIKDITSFPI